MATKTTTRDVTEDVVEHLNARDYKGRVDPD